jgi:choline dehydrogenase-like flavoprotein
MIRDLQTTFEPVTRLRSGVVVIGAGIAGLLLAARLARRGIEVLVLESGSENGPVTAADPLNLVEQAGQPYRGATEGRMRGLGGTSRLWGGAMLPFLPCDMEAHTAGWPVKWPVSYGEVEAGFAEIERTFALPAGSYETRVSGHGVDAGFLTRSAKWPAFPVRNIANVLKTDIANLLVWMNATVTAFELADNGRIARVSARSLNGNRLDVDSDLVVVTAGAIESTRLLLLLDAQYNERIFAPDRQLGHTFFDHLSTSAATITPRDRDRLNRIFSRRFEHGGMRDLRLEPSPALRRKHRLPAAFAHVAAISDTLGGFSALRDVYHSLQIRSGVSLSQVRNLTRDIPWLAQAVHWRLRRGRLLYPRDASLELVLVSEQHPNPGSTIKLSRTENDGLGVPRARIEWRTSNADIEAFAALQELLCAYWNSSEFAALGSITPTPHEQWRSRLQSDSGIFHPGGTTMMGRSVSTGVVDGDLRAFRVPNLTVVSTSCFPSGGSANPTFMLMAFALRAADRIFAEIRPGSATTISAPVSAAPAGTSR